MSTTYNHAVGPHVRAPQPVTHQCRDSGDRHDQGRCAARHPSGQRGMPILLTSRRGAPSRKTWSTMKSMTTALNNTADFRKALAWIGGFPLR